MLIDPEDTHPAGSRFNRAAGGEEAVSVAYPDDYFVFGDVYETLEACQQVELLLSRLRRQRLMDDRTWLAARAHVAEVRKSLETMLREGE